MICRPGILEGYLDAINAGMDRLSARFRTVTIYGYGVLVGISTAAIGIGTSITAVAASVAAILAVGIVGVTGPAAVTASGDSRNQDSAQRHYYFSIVSCFHVFFLKIHERS